MKFLLEFTRDVTTRDGYSVEVDADNEAEASALAERMAAEMDRNCPDGAAETGPVECKSWSVEDVTLAIPGQGPSSGPPPAANDTVDEVNVPLALPMDVWEGLLRAAQVGMPTLGVEDRAAVAAFAALKAHVHIEGEKLVASR